MVNRHIQQMRVLHVIDHLGHGGAQVLLVNICTGADRATSKFEHEVLVLHGSGLYSKHLAEANVQVRSLARRKLDLPIMLTRLAAHLSRYDYDVLHLHLEASTLFGSVIGRLLGNKPVVNSVYSLREQYKIGGYLLFRMAEPFTKRYVTLWENNDLPSIGVTRDKITVIPIGIDFRGADPTRHAVVRRALCEQYSIARERPLLLSVARLHSNRKIHILVEAMRCLVVERPDVALIMVGDGEERGRLEAYVAEHRLERNVIFAGSRTDLWDLLPGCDIYMSSSGRGDTGVAAMQAMACERPVVTYTIAPESMSADEQEYSCQGVFIQTRDSRAMAWVTAALLADPARAIDLGRRGREAIEDQFSMGSMVERYEELYQRLASESDGAGARGFKMPGIRG